jgi:NADH dehydrogenase/NADH:ubiquinone oxidoreductase subunit G
MMKGICPGCSLGCGLYVNEDGTEIDYRRNTVVNQGKLCKFGVSLPHYYRRERTKPMIKEEGEMKEVSLEEAIGEAKNRLKEIEAEKMAFLCFGEATNEEMMAFKELASSFGCKKMDNGLGKFFEEIPTDFHRVLELGLPLEEVESAKKIILIYFDPLVRYPLLARRMKIAKDNGCEILSIDVGKNGMADESILIPAGNEIQRLQALIKYFMEKKGREIPEYMKDYDTSSFDDIDFQDAMIFFDMNMFTDVEMMKTVLNLSILTSSSLFLTKPSLNSSGATLIGFGKDGDILKGIDDGEIRSLMLLETDLFASTIDEGRMRDTLSKLDLLIVQNAYKSEITDIADIVLPNDAFFQKKGTIVNIEGRLMLNGGESIEGIKMMHKIAEGGKNYDELHDEVLKRLGIADINENDVQIKRDEPEGDELLEMKEVKPIEADHFLFYNPNPYMWHGISHKDFVEMSLELVKELKLNKGETVRLISGENTTDIWWKVVDLPKNVLISEIKLDPCKNMRTEVDPQKP